MRGMGFLLTANSASILAPGVFVGHLHIRLPRCPEVMELIIVLHHLTAFLSLIFHWTSAVCFQKFQMYLPFALGVTLSLWSILAGQIAWAEALQEVVSVLELQLEDTETELQKLKLENEVLRETHKLSPPPTPGRFVLCLVLPRVVRNKPCKRDLYHCICSLHPQSLGHCFSGLTNSVLLQE